jgi:anti-sigma regulatory factor (Ser/Thr protein kinase)
MRTVLASATGGKLRLCKGAHELPARLPSTAEPIALSAQALRSVRVQTVAAGRAAGMDNDRGNDLLSGVGEATMNAVVHGQGGRASVEADSASGTVQVWVEDEGAGIALEQLPRATLERGYSGGATPGFGHGFWMMLQLVDRVWLLTGARGTTVVLEQDRMAPEPGWLQQGLQGLQAAA